MSLGQIDFTATSEEEIAGYDAFRDAARAVEERDFPEVLDLSDGGLFALRLDEIVPPTVPPLAEIEDEVAAAWRVTALRDALTARADQLVGQIATGATLEDLGPVAPKPGSGGRISFPTCRPPSWCRPSSWARPAMSWRSRARARPISCGLTGSTRRPATRPTPSSFLQILQQTVAQSMAQDIFESYGRALQSDAGIRLDQSVINAVHAQFP
jgi:peptidyl-prolyl cis-trans isomerase D